MIVNIKRASFKNISEISKLFAISWRHAYKNIVDSEYLSSLSDDNWIEFLEEGISEQKIDCLVAEVDGVIIGATVSRKSKIKEFPDDIELVCFYLLPEYIGTGVGSLLFEEFEKEMKN